MLIDKIKSIIDTHKHYEQNTGIKYKDTEIAENIIHAMYDVFDDKIMHLMLHVDNIRRERAKIGRGRLLKGLKAFNTKLYMIEKAAINNEHKKIKEIVAFYESLEGIHYFLEIGSALFPDGVDNYKTESSRWLYVSIVKSILQNKDALLNDGDSYNFVIENGFETFVSAILDLNKD